MEEPSVFVVVDLAFTPQIVSSAHSEAVFEHSIQKLSFDCHTNQTSNLNDEYPEMDDILENVEVHLSFQMSETETESARVHIGVKIECVLRIPERSSMTQDAQKVDTPLNIEGKPIRRSLTLADRDQLRAMIVMLNESNGVLLKIRQRFPLSASTRCDVIQRQIQLQLQELFAEFRTNDVANFRELIPRNRTAFLLIWDHLSQMIVDLCYHD